MKQKIHNIKQQIEAQSNYSKDRSNKFGEVFTPNDLIDEMLSKLPAEIWEDPTKTFFDPCAGKGNFPIVIIEKLFIGLQDQISDEKERLRSIVERQLYMAELQEESARFIAEAFSFDMGLKPNLYYGNSLSIPEDFFDLTQDQRIEKYPENCIT